MKLKQEHITTGFWKIFYILATILILGMGLEIITAPVPPGFMSPDVAYQAAKILMISKNIGDSFTDPTAGVPSIYPYFYALIGSIPARLFGITPYNVLIYLSFLAFGLFILSVYLIGKTIQNHYSAIVLVCACLIMQVFPSRMYILFLPVSFQLALGVMAMSLFFCLKTRNRYSIRLLLLSASICGIGVGLWPPFLFTLPVFLLIIPGWRRKVLFGLISLGIVGVICLPHYIYVSNAGYLGLYKTTGTLFDLLKIPFIGEKPAGLMAFVCCALYIYTAISIKSDRHNRGYLMSSIVSLAIIIPAYLLFAPVYGARVQMFLNIILFMPFAHYLITQKSWRMIPGIALLVVGMYFVGRGEHGITAAAREKYRKAPPISEIVAKLDELDPNKAFLLCSIDTYREVIMGNTLKYGLSASHDVNYYSLDHNVSEEMHKDYVLAWTTKSDEELQAILQKYDIHHFLFGTRGGFSKESAVYHIAVTAPIVFYSSDRRYAIVKVR
jgi:hypothetical protein